MATKIFVFGSVNGHLEHAFSKLATLHVKNSFNLAVVTGNLFSADQDDESLSKLLSGQMAISCPTYFTVGTFALPPRVTERIEREEEVAPNLHYLGKRSITKTTEGVRIVVLGGLPDPNQSGLSKDQHLPFHAEEDAKALRGAHQADLLLTVAWPAGVWRNSAKEVSGGVDGIPQTEAIADLCSALKPRYHYAMSCADACYEREPFFSAGSEINENGLAITRFIALAPWANATKAKAMYAFTLNRDPVTAAPPGSTLTPFVKPAQRKRPADDSFQRFSQDHQRPHKRRPPPGPDQCFFCLSASSASDHMVCSIGESSYLATAKGPLPSSQTFTTHGLSCPSHIIITPFNHVPKLSRAFVPDAKELDGLFSEMTRFRESLQTMVSTKSARSLGAVTWEISRARNVHMHWQCMPVPVALLTKKAADGKTMVEAGFQVLAADLHLPPLENYNPFNTADDTGGDYLRVWIFENADVPVTTLLMRFGDGLRFDLQYPRKVMAKLLGLEHRAVWQHVSQTMEEEKMDVEAFRQAFEPWDFSAY